MRRKVMLNGIDDNKCINPTKPQAFGNPIKFYIELFHKRNFAELFFPYFRFYFCEFIRVAVPVMVDK